MREKASADLAAMGPSIELDLKGALAANPSAEARTRLKLLLSHVRDAATVNSLPASDDPDTRREQRAIRALARIGTPAAVETLKALADGPPLSGTHSSKLTRSAHSKSYSLTPKVFWRHFAAHLQANARPGLPRSFADCHPIPSPHLAT